MDSKEVILLKKALERQKRARQQAEKILEEKSKQLYDVTQHLRESNSRLESLLTEKTSEMDGVFLNIIDPYVIMDLEFNVVNMNSSAKDFLGFDYTEKSVNLRELVHPEFIQYTAESLSSLVEVGTLKNYRAKIVLLDKVEKWVQINASLVYDSKRKPIAAQGIIRDITNEMEVKQILADQKKQLDIIVENSPLGIVLSSEGKIIKANKTFIKMLGYSESELKEMLIKDYTYSGNDFDKAQNDLMEQMDSGELDQFTMIKKYIKKNGEIVSAKITINTLKSGSDNKDYQVAIIEDITKELEAEERINAERHKYRSIIANMNLGLVEVDNNDFIQLVNQSLCTMSGFEESELLGKKAAEVFNVQNKAIIANKHAERISGVSDSYEVEVLDKNGVLRHWLISGAPRYDENKRIIGSIGIHLDITNQKQLELQKEKLLTELEKSNENLQEYAHIVSHDLKSPLRSISALATWLYDDYNDVLDDSGKENLGLMQEKVASMDRLIHGILEYSTADNSALISTSVNLNEVISEIKDSIYIPEHVDLSIPTPLPIIDADRTKLHQLFQNIISNAVVHIEKENGLVEVLCQEKKAFYQFLVKDNGVGIPKKYHKKIFDIFQSIGDNERSTGIGLSIVKKIVDRYQGEVWVESELGEGTQFYFTLKKELCQNPIK
ncbi:PAS domain S-box protein [Croceitalea marina]|uniref:histidine kinase n=1 Tax=Croceitalea marina TaxID=1775166 RepID=A0ABW5N0C0_9FLAO